MTRQKFEEVFSDTEFVKTLLTLETGEEVQEALASQGVKITEDTLDRFSEVLADALEREIQSRKLSPICEASVVGGISQENITTNNKYEKLFSDFLCDKNDKSYENSWLLHKIRK